ncbi:mitochondrial inner membrane protease atp23-like [Telopea speciosissima]|uniref:mitochondrial inner membrane protease atp23-like n=1 Tax=Telopea speciosissima TaxID=54955 RepID=UPI001CC650ED|nr:mitochondrial inner membrane protease atp23-like [Telopea speciosissima]
MAEEPVTGTASRSSSLFENGGRKVEECEDMIQRSLRTPTVKFLKEHLEKTGCILGDKFIKAVHCDKQISGGYVRGEGVMASYISHYDLKFSLINHMNIQDEVNQVVIHELIHAYDDCRAANLDWANCAHHACSEIRAGHLSGDCHYKRELLRGYMKLRGHEQVIRRRVMKSLSGNPYCPEAAAKDAMEAVWDVCYNDTKPFDRAP